jgi:uncharacterized membrane protein YeaQ/YmgE (transglycosylase-associated protein family)
MTSRNRFKERNTLMSIGMLCLLLGNLFGFVANRFLHTTAPFGQDLVDGVFGVLIGASIALNLLSLRQTDRQCSSDEA